MVSARTISLAAGTVLDVDPPRAVEVAAAAGYDAVGLWFDPVRWDDATTRDVVERLADTGLVALDVEPVILGRDEPHDDHGERLVELAVATGARHVLVASGGAPRSAVVERLGRLADVAADTDVILVLEFLPIFSVASLDEAASIVAEVAHDRVGILVDTLHLDRSGGSPADLSSVPGERLPYLQLADAVAARPTTWEGLRDEALHGRLLPGEGVLPLVETLRAVPSVPVSVELRSRALVERHAEPVARARAVLDATRAVVDASVSRP